MRTLTTLHREYNGNELNLVNENDLKIEFTNYGMLLFTHSAPIAVHFYYFFF